MIYTSLSAFFLFFPFVKNKNNKSFVMCAHVRAFSRPSVTANSNVWAEQQGGSEESEEEL